MGNSIKKVNLLKYTKLILAKHGKSLEDIKFLDDSGEKYTMVTSTKALAKRLNINYNDSYGMKEINVDLRLIGDDFWLERHSYNGSEWWEYKEVPSLEKIAKTCKEVPLDVFPLTEEEKHPEWHIDWDKEDEK